MLKAWGLAASIRPGYLIGVGVLFAVVTAALFKTGILPESSWIWATDGGGAGFRATPSFQAALDASLQQTEARIEAKVQELLDKRVVDHDLVAGGSSDSAAPAAAAAAAAGGGGGGGGGYPDSDVSKLLAGYPKGSKEYKELQRYRYCRGDGDGDGQASNYAPAPGSRLLTWQPEPGKYVFPLCEYGQISNRLNCLRWYMLLAALLNRTLVMPEREGSPDGYMYALVLDVAHARLCIGGSGSGTSPTVITLQEYLETKGLWKNGKQVKNAVVDSIWCWREACSVQTYAGLFPGVSMPKEVSGTSYRTKVSSAEELVRSFGVLALPDEMISFGNLYGINRFKDVPWEAYTNPNLPFANQTCRLVVQPHPALVLAAKGFVKTIIGARYLAVHLRRGDFHHFWGPYCERAGKGAFSTSGCKILSMGAIANCILEKLQGTGINIVYIATNAQPTELGLLERILGANPRGGPPVTLIRAPQSLGQEKYFWANSWKQMGLDDVPLAHATLDKLLCAMAKIFMGSVGSTFTDDIVTMRAGLGTLSCQDQAVCAVFAVSPQDQLPTFNVTFTDPYQGTRNYRRRRRKYSR